jgi:hypothetical protein
MKSSLTLLLLVVALTSVWAAVPRFYQLSLAQNSMFLETSPSQQPAAFAKSFEHLVKEAHNLTQSYQNEVAKWRTNHDNMTMISITDSYLPKYGNLVNQSKMMQPAKQFQNGTDLFTKSLESELQSYKYFKNYLSTHNSTENDLSSKFLSDAFKYEIDSFKALKSSGLFSFLS